MSAQRQWWCEQKVGQVGRGGGGVWGTVCLRVCVKRHGVTFPGGTDERGRLRGCPFPTCVPNLTDDHHRLRGCSCCCCCCCLLVLLLWLLLWLLLLAAATARPLVGWWEERLTANTNTQPPGNWVGGKRDIWFVFGNAKTFVVTSC